MDYATLLTTIASRMVRDDLTSEIPSFIARAEDEINARLSANPVRPMAASTTLSATTADVSLPDDFIDVIDVRANDGTDTWQLVRLDPSDTDWYAPRLLPQGIAYDSSKIRHYSILGSTLSLSDTPTATLSLPFKYYQRIPALSASNTTNWLSIRHADVYEFGAIAHACRHIKDYDEMERYQGLFLGALELAVLSYPEKANAAEMRGDMPLSGLPWSIIDG